MMPGRAAASGRANPGRWDLPSVAVRPTLHRRSIVTVSCCTFGKCSNHPAMQAPHKEPFPGARSKRQPGRFNCAHKRRSLGLGFTCGAALAWTGGNVVVGLLLKLPKSYCYVSPPTGDSVGQARRYKRRPELGDLGK
jgi:hypothetical protein